MLIPYLLVALMEDLVYCFFDYVAFVFVVDYVGFVADIAVRTLQVSLLFIKLV